MPKVNPATFNPNVLREDINFNAENRDDITSDYRIQDVLKEMGTLTEEVGWEERDVATKAFKQSVKEEFDTTYARALALIQKADPNDVLGKVYTTKPLIPKIQFDVADKHTEGFGLHTQNKIGGIPDLRRHWMMRYRENERNGVKTVKSVEEMLKHLWPKNPDGGFLSCYGTAELGAYKYMMSKIVHPSSSFSGKQNDYKALCGSIALFAPWYPGFDNRLDACVIILEGKDETHGISEEEYLEALKNLGILSGEPDYRDEENTLPNHYWEMSNPRLGFDLDTWLGWCCVEESRFGKKYHEKIDDINEAINPWEERKNPENPFTGYGPFFGGEPTTQQEAKRYGDTSTYPTLNRMSPFFGFSHPDADMNYQIYTPRYSSMETANSTYFGKVDASCT